jgi:hypothetical protein
MAALEVLYVGVLDALVARMVQHAGSDVAMGYTYHPIPIHQHAP